MLLGFPAPSDAAADDDDGALGPPCCTRLNPAYRALAHALLPDGGAALLGERAARGAGGAADAFERDLARFSLARGDAPAISRARARAARLGGADALLRGLLAFEPRARPTLRDALLSRVFEPLREGAAAAAADDAPLAAEGAQRLDFMAFHASRAAASVDGGLVAPAAASAAAASAARDDARDDGGAVVEFPPDL